MRFKYLALRNFSMLTSNIARNVTVDLKDTSGMNRSDAQYIVKLNYPDALSYGDINVDKKFVDDTINSIYNGKRNLVYLSYCRELDYFIYLVDLEGKLVLSGFKPVKKDKKLEIVTDLVPVSKLRTYSPKSIVIVDNTKEYKQNKNNE